MNNKEAYNLWSHQYDHNENKTRDLEAKALREVLSDITIKTCLEIGCGTGKNTEWLAARADEITAVDFSEEMLAKAKSKINSQKINFVNADINQNWRFADKDYDLITFSLVLEHIENLDAVFKNAAGVLKRGGYVYVGELHPFKQYSGSKAKFHTGEEIHFLECYIHNISDYVAAAANYGVRLSDIKEFFDSELPAVPRILTLLFEKQ